MNHKNLFPIFSNCAKKGLPLVFFDNASTTQKPTTVIDAIRNFYLTSNSNIHRGLYPLAEAATEQYEAARQYAAKIINAHSTEIAFTKGTTESINLVAYSWANNHLAAGDVILLSAVEHHANLLPWLELARKKNLIIKYIPYDPIAKKLVLDAIDLTSVKLLAVQHTSNVLGNVWEHDFSDLKKLITAVKNQGGCVLLDAAQSIAHLKLDIMDLKTDFLVFSGHKAYGPTGIGIIYINKQLHHAIKPYQVGGSMVYDVSYSQATWQPMPHLLEAGTPPIAEAIGLQSALTFLENNLSAEMTTQESLLTQEIAKKITRIKGLQVVTNHEDQKHQHIVSFYHHSIHAHDIAAFLGEKNIAVRAGNHCAKPLIDFLKVPALVRISIGIYNDQADAESLLSSLSEAIDVLKP